MLFFKRFNNFFKNFFITFLVFLAVFQTAKLWFEDFSGHSPFYLNSDNSKKKQIQKKIINNIESIIFNTGSNKFLQKFNDINNNNFKHISDELISFAIKKGDFKSFDNINFDDIFKNKSIIYNYSYSLQGELISGIFNTKNKNLSKIDSFDLICIIPKLNNTELTKVIFINSYQNKQYEFSLKKPDMSNTLYGIVNSIKLDNSNIYYISSENNGFKLFEKNQFLPKWDKNIFEYNIVEANNPLNQDGGVLLSGIEKYVDIFFENPVTKWTHFVNGTFTFSDENIVVKYHPNNVLEYNSYKATEDKKTNDFIKSYLLAIQFLKNDYNIKNEFYLKNFLIESDKITFYFDYKINDFLINLSEDIKKDTQMDSFIEVVISENKVLKYKRLTYDFVLKNSTSFIETDFLKAIDNVVALKKEHENKKIKSIQLAYNFKGQNQNLKLGWFINIDNKTFFQK